jgi:hypothetical protein
MKRETVVGIVGGAVTGVLLGISVAALDAGYAESFVHDVAVSIVLTERFKDVANPVTAARGVIVLVLGIPLALLVGAVLHRTSAPRALGKKFPYLVVLGVLLAATIIAYSISYGIGAVGLWMHAAVVWAIVFGTIAGAAVSWFARRKSTA